MSKLLRQCLAEALDADAFAITSSRLDKDLLSQCLVVDQTGKWEPPDPRSKLLLSAPSLRTVAVVDRTSDIEQAARQIFLARSAFGGKSPYVPDCVLVNEFVELEFMRAMSQEISEVSATKHDASKAESTYDHHHHATNSDKPSKNGTIRPESIKCPAVPDEKSVVRAKHRYIYNLLPDELED
jgi:aldehyde dehydrogenase (NAD+)